MSKQSEDIKLIRNMMERSSKFLVFSSLSPIFAGFVALVGAIYTYFYLQNASTETFQSKLYVLLPVALLVLSISVVATILFSNAKAKRLKQKLWSKTSAKTLYNLAVPMLAGALFAIILLTRYQYDLIASITLIFYGLGLINASKYIFDELHYLGIIEVALGLLSLIWLEQGLLFWTIGFAICHIIVGIVMYRKYEKK